MGDHSPLVRVYNVLKRTNDILAQVLDVKVTLDLVDSLTHTVLGVANGTKDVVDLIKVDTGGIPDQLTNAVDAISTATGQLDDKVSNVQYLLTSSFGDPSPITNWPTLDLRTFLAGEQFYRPGDGRLIEWLWLLAHQVVPNVTTNHRGLGHVSGPATLALPDCWGVEITASVIPAGQAPSGQPDAPIYEWLCRVSLGRRGFFDHAELMRHPAQLIIPKSFIPDAVALEPRPGVELDVSAIMPVGFI